MKRCDQITYLHSCRTQLQLKSYMGGVGPGGGERVIFRKVNKFTISEYNWDALGAPEEMV